MAVVAYPSAGHPFVVAQVMLWRWDGTGTCSSSSRTGQMDLFGECAGRINQILCDVNCKDDNEMKYFNNLLIVCAIISSASPLSIGCSAELGCAELGSFPAQIVALCPPNAIQRRLRQCLTYMFIIRAYRVRLIIIYRDLQSLPHSLCCTVVCP